MVTNKQYKVTNKQDKVTCNCLEKNHVQRRYMTWSYAKIQFTSQMHLVEDMVVSL